VKPQERSDPEWEATRACRLLTGSRTQDEPEGDAEDLLEDDFERGTEAGVFRTGKHCAVGAADLTQIRQVGVVR